MGVLTSHISCLSGTFSSYRVSFSLTENMTVVVIGLGHLVRALFHFSSENSVGRVSVIFYVNQVKILLVVSVEYSMLVVSVDY